ncbi:putative peptidase [Aquimixticola soesokkakensis]|uniref:Putative peptidase n=1 Tax=Aquimixticola soesokkakensis TaxID=1519096 RepID=A0A1Y5RLT2_9RHOB|nr:M23 family metallopeptidase [Aquimixticola soesokkakensis]SLN20344.1 putative peptidase [Aquimixticola soesokkakensis]
MRLPIDCTPGETCYIQNYVDTDPGPGAADFTCAPLSYDGHKGTDFALPSRAALSPDVAVLAAAPGVVRGIRDGVPDQSQQTPNAPDVSGIECGNGVVIDHGDGWETQYCHLKQGSITVQSGQRVGAGTRLGAVGLSGATEFPHLHLSLRHEGAVIDPFNPDGMIACGTDAPQTLWETPPAYDAGGLIAAGFSAAIPSFDDIKAGTAAAQALPATAPALVLWGYAFGAQAGDSLQLRLTGPSGDILRQTVPLERTQAQLFRAIGKRGTDWAVGAYSGTVEMWRDGAQIDSLTIALTITP